MANSINILKGTLDQITKLNEDGQIDNNDIVVASDYPLIVAQGQMINGSGAPVWNGKTKSFGNTPLQIKDLLTKRLKKTLYFADTSQPKFDITINQKHDTSINKNSPELIRKSGWTWDTSTNYTLYKMFYDEQSTTFSHYETSKEISAEHKANVLNYSLDQIKSCGFETTTFKFPVCQGVSFIITPCESSDWLCQEIDHECCCPAWDDQKKTYKKIYGWDDIDGAAVKYFQKRKDSVAIKCTQSGYVTITCVNGYKKNGYPFAKISFEQ